MTLEELKKQRKQLDKQIEAMENKLHIEVGNVYADLEQESVYVRHWRSKRRVLCRSKNLVDRKGFFESDDAIDIQIEDLINNLQEVLRIMRSNEA